MTERSWNGTGVAIIATGLIVACPFVADLHADAARAAVVQVDRPLPAAPVTGRYLADPGERNDVSLTAIPSGFRIQDGGAAITAGEGCVSLDSRTADCMPSLSVLRLVLGDGDDLLLSTIPTAVRVDGGVGNDRVRGSTGFDVLDGGGGVDELHGEGGDDVLSDGDSGQAPDADLLAGGAGDGDWVSYETRERPVTVDLADPAPGGQRGEGDALQGFENLHGGSGDDLLSGDAGPNSFDDEGGINVFRGRGGDDVFRGARAGLVRCGTGRDQVHGVTRRVQLTPSCERLSDRDRFFEVTPYPRANRRGLTFDIFTDGEDPPLGAMTIREATGGRRLLARGRIRWTHPDATARLRLTTAGRLAVTRRRVHAIVRLSGAERKLAWGIVLAPGLQ
jgi:Ca2+-binding RTX toxin-like protein